MGDFFRNHHAQLHLTYAAPPSLRRAQVAAIWALSAHAIETTDPAQAVLPTGTGKTAVIVALPFALKAERVLIVTPSQVVRRQIARQFATLAILRQTRALAPFDGFPDVRSLGTQVRSADQWPLMRRHDVVVTTPQCVSPAYKRVVPPPSGFFDLLIVDEAHHEPAKTWRALIEHFAGTRRLLLTATPFRRDRRGISGEIAYWYSLHDAIADGVYAPIHFRGVRQGPNESADDAVARTAIARMNSVEHRNARTQLVVRTDQINDALRLRELYARKGLELHVLSSDSSARDVTRVLDELEAGTARGAVVVGVLTEGFDLPRLKIAAYHQKHRSLGATLQFIGRLARTTDIEAAPPELLAIPEEISGETRQLYDEDASWTELLPRIADTAVARERERREYSQTFPKPSANYSRTSIFPPLRIQCLKISHEVEWAQLRLTETWPKQIVRSPVFDYATDGEGVLALAITRDLVHPQWILSDALDSFEYTLHLACLDRERGYLYLTTSTDASRRDILQHYGLEEHTAEVDPQRLNAILHELGVEGYSNIGVRMSRETALQGLSYQILTGSNPTRGIGGLDAAGSSAGHLIGRYREGAEWHSLSVSLDSGRLRRSGEATLLDYRDWCFEVSRLLDTTQAANTPPGLALAVRASFVAYPHDAIGATLPEFFYSGELELDNDGVWINSLSTEVRVRSAGDHLILGLSSANHLIATFTYDLSGRIASRCDIDSRLAGKVLPLSELLADFRPPQFYFADGSTVSGNGLLGPRAYHAALRTDVFEIWTWEDVDIRRESKPARPPKTKNIQERVVEEFARRYPEAWIVVDDGSGEIADVIVLWFRNQRILDLTLIHCKWSTEDRPGRRLDDLYQVACQTIRSTRWSAPRMLLPELVNRIAHRQQTRCVRGTKEEIVEAIEAYGSRGVFMGRVFAVQPGISHAATTDWGEGKNLIAACDDFVSRAGLPLTFCVSE